MLQASGSSGITGVRVDRLRGGYCIYIDGRMLRQNFPSRGRATACLDRVQRGLVKAEYYAARPYGHLV